MTDTNQAELLPCPFCGGEAKIKLLNKDMQYATCNHDGCPCEPVSFASVNMQEVITAWNTRQPSLEALIKEDE